MYRMIKCVKFNESSNNLCKNLTNCVTNRVRNNETCNESCENLRNCIMNRVKTNVSYDQAREM